METTSTCLLAPEQETTVCLRGWHEIVCPSLNQSQEGVCVGESGTKTGQDPLPMEWGQGSGWTDERPSNCKTRTDEWHWGLAPQRQGEALFFSQEG